MQPINVKEVFAEQAKRREAFGKLTKLDQSREAAWSTPRPASTTWPRNSAQ